MVGGLRGVFFFSSLHHTAGYRDQKYITQSADSEHFLIANYHTTDFCTYEIRVCRVQIFYLTWLWQPLGTSLAPWSLTGALEPRRLSNVRVFICTPMR